MTRVEFDVHLAKAIRRGSVTAMKLWAELNVQAGEPPPEPDEFDQIKASRARV